MEEKNPSILHVVETIIPSESICQFYLFYVKDPVQVKDFAVSPNFLPRN